MDEHASAGPETSVPLACSEAVLARVRAVARRVQRRFKCVLVKYGLALPTGLAQDAADAGGPAENLRPNL
jgi:hypothetical protein